MSRRLGTSPVAEPVLSGEDQAAFAKGLAQFNDRFFFECHDTLEEIWSGLRGAPRDFFQGLIQLAVGFYHLGNGNRAGAQSVLRRALARLEPFPARYAGVELEPLRAAIGDWLRALETGAGEPPAPPRIATEVSPGQVSQPPMC